jgi:hypothetical protein
VATAHGWVPAWELSARRILILRAVVFGNGVGPQWPRSTLRGCSQSCPAPLLRRRRARSLFRRMRHRFLGRRNLERDELGVSGAFVCALATAARRRRGTACEEEARPLCGGGDGAEAGPTLGRGEHGGVDRALSLWLFLARNKPNWRRRLNLPGSKDTLCGATQRRRNTPSVLQWKKPHRAACRNMRAILRSHLPPDARMDFLERAPRRVGLSRWYHRPRPAFAGIFGRLTSLEPTRPPHAIGQQLSYPQHAHREGRR